MWSWDSPENPKDECCLPAESEVVHHHPVPTSTCFLTDSSAIDMCIHLSTSCERQVPFTRVTSRDAKMDDTDCFMIVLCLYVWRRYCASTHTRPNQFPVKLVEALLPEHSGDDKCSQWSHSFSCTFGRISKWSILCTWKIQGYTSAATPTTECWTPAGVRSLTPTKIPHLLRTTVNLNDLPRLQILPPLYPGVDMRSRMSTFEMKTNICNCTLCAYFQIVWNHNSTSNATNILPWVWHPDTSLVANHHLTLRPTHSGTGNVQSFGQFEQTAHGNTNANITSDHHSMPKVTSAFFLSRVAGCLLKLPICTHPSPAGWIHFVLAGHFVFN